jgi:putative transcriptional regulator
MTAELRAGRLLVATPDLADPNFSHTVVLLLERNDQGAFGVVLNRPSDVDVAAALPGWEALAAPPDVVLVGGPVQQDGVVALGIAGQERQLTKTVLPTVGVVDLEQDPVLATVDLERVRLFAGYAGWTTGQLESEVAEGGWFVVEADPADVFADDPEDLWRSVLQRQGGIFKTVPEDPSLN